jgi:hypothetical protein
MKQKNMAEDTDKKLQDIHFKKMRYINKFFNSIVKFSSTLMAGTQD